MTPDQIMEKCKGLSVAKTRKNNEKYCELVFFDDDLDKWDEILASMLGPAEKPRFKKPSKDQQVLTKEFGGIRHNQTLYKKDIDGSTLVAMFWPWRDRTHTTLKVGLVK